MSDFNNFSRPQVELEVVWRLENKNYCRSEVKLTEIFPFLHRNTDLIFTLNIILFLICLASNIVLLILFQVTLNLCSGMIDLQKYMLNLFLIKDEWFTNIFYTLD